MVKAPAAYSSATSHQDIIVVDGTFDLAAIHSAAGNAGTKSQFYDPVEVLASQTSDGDQIALIGANTLKIGQLRRPNSAPIALFTSAPRSGAIRPEASSAQGLSNKAGSSPPRGFRKIRTTHS